MAVQGETIVIFGYETGLRQNGVNKTTSTPYSLPTADLVRFVEFLKVVGREHEEVPHPDLNDPVALNKFVGDYHLTRVLIATNRTRWIEGTSAGTIELPIFVTTPNVMMDDGNIGDALAILTAADTGSYRGSHIAHPDTGALFLDLEAEKAAGNHGV